jgi:SAM-dependent methyltransferase
MLSQEELIKWKTDAWKDPGMVSWYSGRMVENSATMPLKHALEVGLCVAHAKGNKILDVGIGTGRGSLPLARQGREVTGIDSSQAMLDETRRLAGDTPITLQLGDVERLAFQDEEFDTLLSLNVVVHFPHWRKLLPEWKRVVRPGGRIVFDVHSLDNYRCAYGEGVTEHGLLQQVEKNGDFSAYVLRVAAEDMVAEADKLGLRVAALVPYGAFLGGGNTNYLMEGLERQWSWRRLLSWMALDQRFHDFGLFLEQELVAKLSTRATGRYMVVLDNVADPEGNRAWLARNEELNRLMRSSHTFTELMESVGMDGPRFCAALNGHVGASLRNFTFFYALYREILEKGWGELPAGVLEQKHLEHVLAWRQHDRADQEALHMARTWFAPPEMKHATENRGVSLGEATEYFLVERVLTDYMGVFTGERV